MSMSIPPVGVSTRGTVLLSQYVDHSSVLGYSVYNTGNIDSILLRACVCVCGVCGVTVACGVCVCVCAGRA